MGCTVGSNFNHRSSPDRTHYGVKDEPPRWKVSRRDICTHNSWILQEPDKDVSAKCKSLGNHASHRFLLGTSIKLWFLLSSFVCLECPLTIGSFFQSLNHNECFAQNCQGTYFAFSLFVQSPNLMDMTSSVMSAQFRNELSRFDKVCYLLNESHVTKIGQASYLEKIIQTNIFSFQNQSH